MNINWKKHGHGALITAERLQGCGRSEPGNPLRDQLPTPPSSAGLGATSFSLRERSRGLLLPTETAKMEGGGGGAKREIDGRVVMAMTAHRAPLRRAALKQMRAGPAWPPQCQR